MASSKILKNLIDLFKGGVNGLINRVDPETGIIKEVKTVKAQVPGKQDVIVYDVFQDYVYSDLSAALSYSKVSGKNYMAPASGKVINPTLSYSIKETERGNSGELYGTTTFTTGQKCHHDKKSSPVFSYTFNYASGTTTDDVVINSTTGVLTVKDRTNKVDIGDERTLGTVTMKIEWADKSKEITTGVIYQQCNVLEKIELDINPLKINYMDTASASVTATYTSGTKNDVTIEASYSIVNDDIITIE